MLGKDTPEGRRLLSLIEDAHEHNYTHDEAVRDIVRDLDILEVQVCAWPDETHEEASERLRGETEDRPSAGLEPELLSTLLERATRGLVDQGGPATDERGRPMVITPDGARRSSLGWLLTEEQAREAQRRGLEPWRDGELALWVFGEDTPEGRDFLEWIREAHDIRCCDFLAGFEHDMGVMRDAWGLGAANPAA